MANRSIRSVILVVEDEWFVRAAMVEELTDRDCLVLEAASGEDALAYLDGQVIVDVLFTDIHLGNGINGWDLAEAFREKDPKIGVFYTSGHLLGSRRDVPGSRFFPKPYSRAAVGEACLEMANQKI